MYASGSTVRVPARAERCIFVFLEGGPSQIDLYDPKPKLRELHGSRLPESVAKEARLSLLQRESAVLIGSPRRFAKHGQCGMELSELLPHLSTCVDDMALVRSVYTDAFNHHPGRLLLHTGEASTGQPTLGSRLAHALDAQSEEVPCCAVLTAGREIGGGASAWTCGALPDRVQPVPFDDDLRGESAQTREEYGVDRDDGGRGEFAAFARSCLAARRLVERGARFVNVHHASWDHHRNLDAGLDFNCSAVDRPLAALLKDLKQRGLLDSTLVLCAGEFGRAPLGEHLDGRDHHPGAFSVWMAGGGVRGGQVIGATDELGMSIVEHPVHVRDLHATVFRLFGLDPEAPNGKAVKALLA
jgi:hypothetical protein